MRVVPDTDRAAIEFCETHRPVWAADPAAVGLTDQRCAELLEPTRAARAAYDESERARQAALAATATLHERAGSMRSAVAGMVKSVKAFAEASAAAAPVYAAARIPEPARRSPRPAPPPPSGVATRLNADGSVTLAWRARGAAPSTGCVFIVSRRLGAAGGYRVVGAGVSLRGGKFELTDATIPAGTASASYLIQGRRGSGRAAVSGESSAAVVVNLGVSGELGTAGEEAAAVGGGAARGAMVRVAA